MDDSDLWSRYAQGVQKINAQSEEKTAAPQEKQQKAQTESQPQPAPVSRKGPLVTIDTMPEAWRQKIEGAPAVVTPELPPVATMPPAPSAPSAPTAQERSTPIKTENVSAPLDTRIERNLSLGDVMIEARLDLHGKTEARAHEELCAFLLAERAKNRRLVLVITGKGRDGLSVLRHNLPRWCEVAPLDAAVQAVRLAAPHHGGEGAYYILLQKRTR